MAPTSLRETLNTVGNWEGHFTPSVPRPHRPPPRTLEERAADRVTAFAGSMLFVYLHGAWFGFWILINLGLVAAAVGLLPPFDPFPFGLLTMIVSLEAIFLATFVMISQNRLAAVADHRAELDYRVNVKAEAEIARLLILLEALVTYHAEQAEPPLRSPPARSAAARMPPRAFEVEKTGHLASGVGPPSLSHGGDTEAPVEL
jgi:uncharacterized membrane protein